MISEVPSGVRVLGPGGALYKYGSLFWNDSPLRLRQSIV